MYKKNIIIGAGPAGLQLAYYFEKYNMDYIILEKNNISGSFFDNYPHCNKLISINKKNTGKDNKEFNLRHDWNSLLSDDYELLFTNFSNEYYPDKEDILKYLNEFSNKYNIKIQYNSFVKIINKVENKYFITVNKDEIYTCEKLIIATGLSKPHIPKNIDIDVKNPIKHYGEYEKNFFNNEQNLNNFINKTVLLIGNGNSSFELANLLNNYCSSIIILGKHNPTFSITSNYTGSVRSIYLPFLDTFFLKSLNAMNIWKGQKIIIKQNHISDKYSLFKKNNDETLLIIGPSSPNKADIIILCTGWEFDETIFSFDVQLVNSKKYPNMKSNYESVNNNNLYFIGTLMHAFDYKKSSGGFIHGFRYLIKNFFILNYLKSFEYQSFNIFEDIDNINNVVNHIIYKINYSSALYQMHSVICDFFYYDPYNQKFIYYNDITKNFILDNYIKRDEKINIYFMLTLEYSDEKNFDLRTIGTKKSDIGSESKSTFLHPIITVYNNFCNVIDIIHFDENLILDFTNRNLYFNKIRRTLIMFLDNMKY